MGLKRTFDDAVQDAFRGLADDAMRVAIRRSSGRLSNRDRKQNPYAARRGRSLRDPSIINVSSGAFRSDWRAFSTPDSAGLRNDNPVAEFFRGTSRMVERPIASAIEQDMAVPVDQRSNDVVRAMSKAK